MTRLSVGGTAELFLAFLPGPGGFKKFVALNQILPGIRSDEQFVKMSLDAARISAALSHSNIGQVFELGRDGAPRVDADVAQSAAMGGAQAAMAGEKADHRDPAHRNAFQERALHPGGAFLGERVAAGQHEDHRERSLEHDPPTPRHVAGFTPHGPQCVRAIHGLPDATHWLVLEACHVGVAATAVRHSREGAPAPVISQPVRRRPPRLKAPSSPHAARRAPRASGATTPLSGTRCAPWPVFSGFGWHYARITVRAMRAPVIFAAALWLAACSGKKDGIEAPKWPFDLNLFPSLTGNSKLLADVGAVRLEFDPTTRDAIVALGECVDAAVYCYEPGTKELSWCLQNTRTCKGDTPWTEEPCCPQRCKDDFEASVSRGTAPPKALEQVFFVETKCFPGVREALVNP